MHTNSCTGPRLLRKLFRTAYYVAKEEIAFAKFPGLCKLQIANGIDLSNTYMNDHHAYHNFIGALAHVHSQCFQMEAQTRVLSNKNLSSSGFCPTESLRRKWSKL